MGNTQSTRRDRTSHGNHRSGGNTESRRTESFVGLSGEVLPVLEHIDTEEHSQQDAQTSQGLYGPNERPEGQGHYEHASNSSPYNSGFRGGDQSLAHTRDGVIRLPDSVSQSQSSPQPQMDAAISQNSMHNNSSNNTSWQLDDQETTGHAIRLRRRASLFERRVSSLVSSCLSLTDAFRRHTGNANVAHREIRGPFPIDSSHDLLPRDLDQSRRFSSDISTPPSVVHEQMDESARPAGRGRLSRARHSIRSPLLSMFRAHRNRGAANVPRSPTPHPGHGPDQSDLASLSDSQYSARPDRNTTAHELDATETETRHLLSASRIASSMTSIRRFPQGLRSRSTRLIRRGEHPPLSQVLQLAAAAIAAQLSGHTSGTAGTRPMGGEAFDGSIQNFVQTLQEAASAQAGENIDLNATDSDLPPVNFMRVFQFPNDENGVPIGPPLSRFSNRTHPVTDSDPDRSVTLVLVGVRSMPNLQDTSGQEGGTPGPSLDTLLSLPFMPPANILRNGSSGALFRRSDTRARDGRRHSLTNFNFPSQFESQRHASSRTGSRGTIADQALPTVSNAMPASISESPPGPHPPPSTPADLRSGHVTPVQRPSSASAGQTSLLPHLEEDIAQSRQLVSSLEPSASTTATTSHQRRRSDSDFARRPELGSGASRRNGVVEPDRASGGAGRSWLIYVVGTNVSPDHPAFTMPSLFTDNPSYEDMQMLSTLLGSVKPPVATQDDVNSAGGTYRLIAQNGLLMAVSCESETLPCVAMVACDRCLICLCDYEAEELVRQLDSCNHIFHRDCIDEWLTTGRNSCPMCRGQGVKEHSSSSNSASSTGQVA